MLDEAMQKRAIGNPRHHITVRDDWRRPARTTTLEAIALGIVLGIFITLGLGALFR